MLLGLRLRFPFLAIDFIVGSLLQHVFELNLYDRPGLSGVMLHVPIEGILKKQIVANSYQFFVMVFKYVDGVLGWRMESQWS